MSQSYQTIKHKAEINKARLAQERRLLLVREAAARKASRRAFWQSWAVAMVATALVLGLLLIPTYL